MKGLLILFISVNCFGQSIGDIPIPIGSGDGNITPYRLTKIGSGSPLNIASDSLSFSGSGSAGAGVTVGQIVGKKYWEGNITSIVAALGSRLPFMGIAKSPLTSPNTFVLGSTSISVGWRATSGTICIQYNFGSGVANGNGACTAQDVGQVIGFAMDADAGTIDFYVNNVLEYTLTNASLTGGGWYPAVQARTSCAATMNFGPVTTYAPPAGYSTFN